FDLGGGEVLAAPDDHVVGASDHEQVAGLVDETEISGVEPTGVVALRRIREVLAGDLLAAHEDLARLAGRRDPAGVVDAQLDPGQRPAGRLEATPDRRVAALEGVAV